MCSRLRQLKLAHTSAKRLALSISAGFIAATVLCPRCSTMAAQASSLARETVLSGQIELARLVDMCAEQMGLSIEYDPTVLKGGVTIRGTEPLSDEELWSLTNRVLASRGFTTVNADHGAPNIINVVKLSDAPGLAPIALFDTSKSLAGFSSGVIRIEHQTIKTIVDAVKQTLSKPSGAIVDLGIGGLVLISDFEPRLKDALELIKLLDVPDEQIAIERVTTQFASPESLVALCASAVVARDFAIGKSLKGKLISGQDEEAVVLICPANELEIWRDLIRRFDEREVVITRSYSPRHFGVAEVGKLVEQVSRDPSATGQRGSGNRWRLVPDELTGTLVITATLPEHEKVESLLSRLDSMPLESRRPLRTFTIHNRIATEVSDVIEKLLATGVLEQTQTSDAVTPTEGTALLSQPEENGSGSRAIGTRTSTPKALIATPPANVSSGSGQQTNGHTRESPRESLTLTVDEGTNTLIAVGPPKLLDQIEDLIRQLDIRQPQVMIEIMVVSLSEADTLDLGFELKKIEIDGSTAISLSSLFGLGTPAVGVPANIGAGRGFSGVVLSPGDFSVVVRALQTVNRGRTLSLPKALVNNGEQATLDSVLQQPFVSVNASDTVATTTFGGSEDAGTQITVKPQIAEGDHLILEYTVTLSSFVGEAVDPTLPPPKQSNNLSSVVTIPDGYTVVVGGLEINTEADGVSQIPLIGDVPLIGEAFKNRSKSFNKTRFFVFIHSEVLRHNNFEDLKFISAPAIHEAGIGDDWPVVDPRVIR
jgi:general secretion pathway protein D